MMGRRGVLGLMAVSALALLSGCGIFGKSISYRYRLTVEVDTPQGVKIGSSVIQIDEAEQGGLEGSHLQVRMTGEAVAVDLQGSKTLFALLDGSPLSAITQKLQAKPSDWYAVDKALKDTEGVFDVPRTVANFRGKQVDAWPMLVTFGDVADPRTVKRVDPDDAAATLGEGIRIRRITVEMTDDDVTTGIEKRLPERFWSSWARAHNDEMEKNGGVMKNPYFQSLPGQLNKNSFVKDGEPV